MNTIRILNHENVKSIEEITQQNAAWVTAQPLGGCSSPLVQGGEQLLACSWPAGSSVSHRGPLNAGNPGSPDIAERDPFISAFLRFEIVMLVFIQATFHVNSLHPHDDHARWEHRSRLHTRGSSRETAASFPGSRVDLNNECSPFSISVRWESNGAKLAEWARRPLRAMS